MRRILQTTGEIMPNYRVTHPQTEEITSQLRVSAAPVVEAGQQLNNRKLYSSWKDIESARFVEQMDLATEDQVAEKMARQRQNGCQHIPSMRQKEAPLYPTQFQKEIYLKLQQMSNQISTSLTHEIQLLHRQKKIGDVLVLNEQARTYIRSCVRAHSEHVLHDSAFQFHILAKDRPGL